MEEATGRGKIKEVAPLGLLAGIWQVPWVAQPSFPSRPLLEFLKADIRLTVICDSANDETAVE
jgi:hypothetical protein